MHIGIRLCVDTKDLVLYLSIQSNSIDKSIRADDAYTRYEFQVGIVNKMTWIPKKRNCANVLTKKDGVLSDAHQLTLYMERLTLPYENFAVAKSSTEHLG